MITTAALLSSALHFGPGAPCVAALHDDAQGRLEYKLEQALLTEACKTGLDPHLSLAIGMVESRLTPGACRGAQMTEDGIACTDVTRWQFHYVTVKNLGLNLGKLMRDGRYALRQHVLLLARKIQGCQGLDTPAWACYHSRTAKHRRAYAKRVRYWLTRWGRGGSE